MFFIAGLYFFLLALAAMAFEETQNALMNGDYLELATITTNFQQAGEQSWGDVMELSFRGVPLVIAGFNCLAAFAFLSYSMKGGG